MQEQQVAWQTRKARAGRGSREMQEQQVACQRGKAQLGRDSREMQEQQVSNTGCGVDNLDCGVVMSDVVCAVCFKYSPPPPPQFDSQADTSRKTFLLSYSDESRDFLHEIEINSNSVWVTWKILN
jgi:hypothetical protein